MNKTEFNTDLFLKNLDLKNWFRSCGQTTINQTNNLKYANSLTNAILIWGNNAEPRKDEWEKLLVKLSQNKNWNDQFEKLKTAYTIELKRNSHFNKFIGDAKRVAKQSIEYNSPIKNISELELVSQFPILGYFGETLLNNNTFKYYTKEIELFKKGYFVSEHLGDKFLIY